jgi:hypothetical protein
VLDLCLDLFTYVETNKMTLKNSAIVFAPNMIDGGRLADKIGPMAQLAFSQVRLVSYA